MLRAVKTQQTATSGIVTVRNRYAYDPAGRLLKTWQQHQLQGKWEPEVLLTSNTYEGMGELTQKKLHSRDGVNFLQTEDFKYDLHGQLMSINKSNDLLVSNPENDLFALNIIREGVESGSTPRYDGGISAVSWATHNAAQTNQPERQRRYTFKYDELGRLKDALYQARPVPWTGWGYEQGAYDEKDITYDANGNIKSLTRYTQASLSAAPMLLDQLSYAYSGNRLARVDDTGDQTRGFKDQSLAVEYDYDDNGSVTNDANKGVTFTYNVLNKVEKQQVGSSSIRYTYDGAGMLLKRETSTGAGTKTEHYIEGCVYEASASFTGLRSVPTPEGRALITATPTATPIVLTEEPEGGGGIGVVAPRETKLTYEYHLRDHLGNLRVAFRAEASTTERKLAWENSEASFSGFDNVGPSRMGGISYHGPGNAMGSYSAGVSAFQPGPSTRIAVSDGAAVKVSLWYQTPDDALGLTAASPAPPALRAGAAVAVAPALLPLVTPRASEYGKPVRVAPGAQVSISGLLSGLWAQRTASKQQAAELAYFPQQGLQAPYVQWRLYNEKNEPIGMGYQNVPLVPNGSWDKLRFIITPDLSSQESRNGYLEVQLLNGGSNPTYYDSLTVRYPQDKALVSQENHYYPFGMNLSGVAVNTVPVPTFSKEQFNEGSTLEDELLGTEAGVYSTFYRTYDPTIGRFQGVDPLAHLYADQSAYHFSNNDPVNYNDPSGALVAAGGNPVRDILNWFRELFSGDGGGGGGTQGNGQANSQHIDRIPFNPGGNNSSTNGDGGGGHASAGIPYISFSSFGSNYSNIGATPTGGGGGGGRGGSVSPKITIGLIGAVPSLTTPSVVETVVLKAAELAAVDLATPDPTDVVPQKLAVETLVVIAGLAIAYDHAPKGVQYTLIAQRDDFYAVYEWGKKYPQDWVYLAKGDTWKIGETLQYNFNTKRQYRYRQSKLDRWGVDFRVDYVGNKAQIMSREYLMLLQYYYKNKKLPPGNKTDH